MRSRRSLLLILLVVVIIFAVIFLLQRRGGGDPATPDETPAEVTDEGVDGETPDEPATGDETVTEESAADTEAATADTPREDEEAAGEETSNSSDTTSEASETSGETAAETTDEAASTEAQSEEKAEATTDEASAETPDTTDEAATSSSSVTTGPTITYVVQPGDNLFLIGLPYGLQWTEIAAINNLDDPNDLEVGQQILIPAAAPAAAVVQPAAPAATPRTHTVQAGQNLFRIALSYDMDWMYLAQANNIGAPYMIHVGQTLTIPTP